jgi:hypothetical protein
MRRLLKICGVCQTEHEPDARGICRVCNQPLGGIEPTELDDTPLFRVPNHPSGEELGLVRCAACGRMTRDLTLCDNCNEELHQPISGSCDASDIQGGVSSYIPGHTQSANASALVGIGKLVIVVGTQTFECRDGDILGKEGTLASQIFRGIQTVSRRHVLVTQKDGRWFLTVFAGVQNATQLDGQELRRGIPYALTGNQQLKMSHACEVNLRVSPI